MTQINFFCTICKKIIFLNTSSKKCCLEKIQSSKFLDFRYLVEELGQGDIWSENYYNKNSKDYDDLINLTFKSLNLIRLRDKWYLWSQSVVVGSGGSGDILLRDSFKIAAQCVVMAPIWRQVHRVTGYLLRWSKVWGTWGFMLKLRTTTTNNYNNYEYNNYHNNQKYEKKTANNYNIYYNSNINYNKEDNHCQTKEKEKEEEKEAWTRAIQYKSVWRSTNITFTTPTHYCEQ